MGRARKKAKVKQGSSSQRGVHKQGDASEDEAAADSKDLKEDDDREDADAKSASDAGGKGILVVSILLPPPLSYWGEQPHQHDHQPPTKN